MLVRADLRERPDAIAGGRCAGQWSQQHCMPVGALRAAMAQSRTLNGLLLKYVKAFMVQAAHTAIANARASLGERLARWLLMAHDRATDATILRRTSSSR